MSARLAIWLVSTFALSLWFTSVAARDLGNFRPVSNDEVKLIEVGYELATHGVLGSDMYAGFFGADDHHLWTLPVQHILDPATFRVFGAGIAQARSLSVIAGLAVLWSVGWLVLRWYGLAAALICELRYLQELWIKPD